MGARVRIYHNGLVLPIKAYYDNDSVHEEEIGASNIVRVSFSGEDNIPIPVGSYIELEGVKYRTFETYYPKQNGMRDYKYSVEFMHPIMFFARIPYFHLDGDTSSWQTADKESEWSFNGYAATLVEDAVSYINRFLDTIQDGDAMEDLKYTWSCLYDEFGQKVIDLTISAMDIVSVLSSAAEQCGCEFHFDFSTKTLYFGNIGSIHAQGEQIPSDDDLFVLKSGYNVTHANIVSQSGESYYNRYIVRGGTTNLSQPSYMGGNTRVTKRLTLDEDNYPDSIIDLRGNANVPDAIRANASEPPLTGQITIDDVYPKLRMYVYGVRERRCYKLDDEGNETTDVYSKWYIKLAYRTSEQEAGKTAIKTEEVNGTTYYWYQYVITDDKRIMDVDLQFSFIPNYDSELSSPLAGRTFQIVTFDEETQENAHNVDGNFTVEPGEYRIEFEDDNGFIIPSTKAQGLYPREVDEENHLPSTMNNIVSVIGVVVTDEMKAEAKSELLQEAIRYITDIRKDKNAYTFDSYVIKFKRYRENGTLPHVGQKIIYDDGGSLKGLQSYRVVTKVRRMTTHLTDLNNIRIDVGNEKIVGRRESYEKKVDTLITYVGGSTDGSMSDTNFLNLLYTYGSKYFLSKTKADTAQGIITLANGVFFGPDGLNVWGYVRSVIENGVTKAKAWFQNLYANYFESINTVITGHLKGGANGLLIQDDVKVEKANGQDAQLQVATLKSTNIENSDTVKTHNLIVTGLAHFFELIIDKIRASGGAEIKSAAEGFKVEAIWECELSLPYDPDNQLGETIDARRLYFLAKDPEGRQRIQSWKRLDQAICMTFNASAGTSYNVSNKYFWALVGGVSETPVEIEIDGEIVECHYIDIYTGDGTETSAQIPVDENGIKLWDGLPSAVAVGDEIAMLGYRGTDEPARQSAIYESAYSALDLELTAPLHAVYMGINDFNLSSHRKSFSDATRNTFIGEFYSTYIANGGKDLAHELNDITSRAIIKGGSEKQRLRLLYSELKAKYLRLAIDMNASAWYSNTDTYKDSGTIPHYNFAPTYQNINSAIDDIWNSLHGLLNCYVDEFGELQIYDDQNEEYPFWLNDDNVSADTDLNAMEDPYKQKKDITDDDFSLSTFYEETWRNVYEVFQEAEYAIDVFTRKIVDEAAVDGVLSGKEKSMLRTAFANEVNRYFEIKSELASFGKTIYKRDNSTPVTTDDVRDAINALGTYLNAGQAWKVEPMSGDASGTDYWHEGNDYVYPSMLTSASTTASTTIEASTYQTKWNDWFSARDEIVSDMAYARQEIVNNIITDTVPPFYYVGAINPLEDPQTSSRVKDGDHWYKPVTLTNPTNGQTISNIDGKPIYDHYVCKTIEGGLDWVLLTAATQAVMSVADAIYLSVFDSSNSSSIVQLVNKITEKVSGTGITGANLILNSAFDAMADGNPEHFMKEGNVDWERTTEQMPTGFNHSLLITAGAGEGIRMQNPSQPKLRLDNGQNHILSAFVRIASANNVTPILQVRRGVNASTNVLQELELEGDLWQRISLNITGDNIAEPIKFTLKTAGTFYITGIQLEKGSILTAWRKAEEDWQGSIDLLKDRINLSVTKDGLRQAGMEISGDDKSVTLFGKQVKVDGDLDLQGLTTENVTKIPYDITRPVVVNMGIFEDETDADNVTVKSVQFEARNVALDGTNTGIPRLVALPFYDSAIEGNDEDWKAQTNIAFSADNTFSIFADNSVPDSLKRIIQYKKTGTRITITNEADQFAKNWQRLMDSANANNAQQDVPKLRGNAIVVCSDARLLAEENYDGEDGVYEFEKRLLPNDGYGVVPKWNGGLFSCGGYLARFIAVLPGQTLQLRSQIMKIDVHQEVLVWVVENPTEFIPMINPLIIDTGEMVYLYGDSHDNTNPLPTVNFTSSYNGILDTWMGHEVLNKVEQSPFEIALVR